MFLIVEVLIIEKKLTQNFYFRNVQTKSPTLSHNLNPGPFGDNLNEYVMGKHLVFQSIENKR